MKYHAKTIGFDHALCGAVANKPDVFVFEVDQFKAHHAKEFECKRCAKMLAEMEDKNIRFVVTAIQNGSRTLAESRNHLHTYETREIAEQQLKAIIKNNRPEDVLKYIGSDLKVMPVECYETGDPKTCWFNDKQANP